MQAQRSIREDYEDKQDLLWEWVTNSDRGVMGFSFMEVPEDCINFCVEQFHRFNVPFSVGLYDVINAGASASFYCVDTMDPYCIFRGVSDVDFTNDWAHFTYQVGCPDGTALMRELEPQFVETYRAVPGQAEEMFNHMYARPGLLSLPNGLGYTIDELLEGRGDECWDSIDAEVEKELRAICTPPGAAEPEKGRMKAYFELAAWAGFVWLAGPLGRQYRRDNHEVMSCAMEHGECIVADWTIIPPKYYTRIDRPPLSCHRCGTQTWCVEQTLVMGNLHYICEACLNFDMPKYGVANCGSKFCKDATCPNHPFAHMGAGGAFAAMAKGGQLSAMVRNEGSLRLFGYRDGQLRLS